MKASDTAVISMQLTITTKGKQVSKVSAGHCKSSMGSEWRDEFQFNMSASFAIMVSG